MGCCIQGWAWRCLSSLKRRLLSLRDRKEEECEGGGGEDNYLNGSYGYNVCWFGAEINLEEGLTWGSEGGRQSSAHSKG